MRIVEREENPQSNFKDFLLEKILPPYFKEYINSNLTKDGGNY